MMSASEISRSPSPPSGSPSSPPSSPDSSPPPVPDRLAPSSPPPPLPGLSATTSSPASSSPSSSSSCSSSSLSSEPQAGITTHATNKRDPNRFHRSSQSMVRPFYPRWMPSQDFKALAGIRGRFGPGPG